MNPVQPLDRAATPRIRPRWAIPAALGALALATLLAFGIWRLATAGTGTTQYHPPRPPVPLPALYYATAREHIAQGLGLAVAQVAAEIRAHPDQGIFGVAGAQGLSPDQLYTLEVAALQAAGNQMVASGRWTRQQADATLHYWQARDAKSLGADVTGWFQGQ